MTDVQGTTMEVEVVSVVDGDTVKVDLQGEETNVRILALDTEESWAGSSKPRTPCGIEAEKQAQSFLPEGRTITLEFPGDEPVEQCLERYRDNYGRPMAYVHYDGEDFQERMIGRGTVRTSRSTDTLISTIITAATGRPNDGHRPMTRACGTS